MYSDKENILQLVALMRAHRVKNVVVCPGSRNAPIVQTLTSCSDFRCHSAIDERSAGFFALGIAQKTGFPAAVCCTSGTALLNLHSAVAEAFYQKIPLLVISADRPAAWIGQMDGQTLPQPGVFGSLVKKSVTLPEPSDEEGKWYCNRLINEALLELERRNCGPVHINVPISEPLFQYTRKKLPSVRVIKRCGTLDMKMLFFPYIEKEVKVMLVIGQQKLAYVDRFVLEMLAKKGIVVLAEHLANEQYEGIITNFDEVMYAHSDDENLAPDLVITVGGHIVSKRLKQFLRKVHPAEHWHVSADGEIADTFRCLTAVIEAYTDEFFMPCHGGDKLPESRKDFLQYWNETSNKVKEQADRFTKFGFSDLGVMKAFLAKMPGWSVLHLANSSAVRNAQLFDLPQNTIVCCNRGTSGIDGSLSTAIGFAAGLDEEDEDENERLNFLVIGDLSFFYDMNGLWNPHVSPFMRILLINNNGGEIFRLLPGLKDAKDSLMYVSGVHQTNAEGIASSLGVTYLKARSNEELEESFKEFLSEKRCPMLLEVATDREVSAEVFRAYYHNLKNK